MKKRWKILLYMLLFLFFITSGAAFLLFNSDYWSKPFLSLLNGTLKNRYGIEIQAKELTGNIFSNLHFQDFTVITDDDTEILKGQSLAVGYVLPSILSAHPELKGIEMDGISISYPSSIDNFKRIFKKDPTDRSEIGKELEIPFGIRNFHLAKDSSDAEIFLGDLIYGTLSIFTDSVLVNVDTAEISLDKLKAPLKIQNGYLTSKPGIITLKKWNLLNQSANICLNGELYKNSPERNNLNITAKNLIPSEYFSHYGKYIYEEDFIDLAAVIKPGKSTDIDLTFSGKLQNRKISEGNLISNIDNKRVEVDKFSFIADDEKIDGYFDMDFKQSLNAHLDFESINLQKWNLVDTETKLAGLVDFQIYGNLKKPEYIKGTVNLRDSGLDTLNFNRIYGEMIYQDNKLIIMDTLFCELQESRLKLLGSCNFEDSTLNAEGYFKSPDLQIFSPIARGQNLQGSVDTYISASGNLRNPDIEGWINGKNIGVPQLNFLKSNIQFELLNVREEQYGDLIVNAEGGSSVFLKSKIPNLSMNVRFNGDTALVRSIDVIGEDIDIYMDGYFVNFSDFYFNNLTGNIRNNRFSNLQPVNFNINNDTLLLHPTQFLLNDKKIAFNGKTINNQVQNVSFEFEEFDITPINDLVNVKNKFGGILTGKVDYDNLSGNHGIDISLSGTKLQYSNTYAHKFTCSAELIENKLIIEEMEIIDSTGGNIKTDGYFSCNFPFAIGEKFLSKSDSVKMKMEIYNLQMKFVNSFLLKKIKMDGKVYGSISIDNNINTPDITGELFIQDPIIDKVKGNILNLSARYDKDKLKFDYIYFADSYGDYTSAGYLPLDIRILDGVFRLPRQKPLNMEVSVETSSLTYLSKYIKKIEKLEGDIRLYLLVTGTMSDPIRTGNLFIEKGDLRISLIENSIKKMKTKCVMTDNILTVQNFSGYMYKEENKDIAKIKYKIKSFVNNIFATNLDKSDKPNIKLSGKVDMTKINQPDYDLKLKGEKVYIRTILAEQEGISSVNLNITGKDTVYLDGEAEILDFVLRNEFKFRTEKLEENVKRKRHTEINLHVIAPGNLYFKNSQLDCELEGEAWLIKSDANPVAISGDLQVLDGSFYYYDWEFKDLAGTILFRPTELTPNLDLEAYVDLSDYLSSNNESSTVSDDDDENITRITLTGDFDQPNLDFESEKYSQSDILRILTRTYDSDSQLSDNATTMFGNYFQRQLERNVGELSGFDEFQLRTKGELFNSEDLQLSLMLGRKVTDKLYITYEKDFDKLNPKMQVGFRYRLDRKKSFSGSIDDNGLFQIKYRFRQHY